MIPRLPGDSTEGRQTRRQFLVRKFRDYPWNTKLEGGIQAGSDATVVVAGLPGAGGFAAGNTEPVTPLARSLGLPRVSLHGEGGEETGRENGDGGTAKKDKRHETPASWYHRLCGFFVCSTISFVYVF